MAFERRRGREKDIKKNTILKAARKLFFEKGFKYVTVENIAKKAELSKGSVYLHFKSKDEIYSRILLNDIDKFHEKISDLLSNEACARDVLFRLADIYIDFFLKDRELFRILMKFMLNVNHRNLPDEIRDHLIKTTNRSADVIENILRYGIEHHEFSPLMNLRQNKYAVWGLMNGIISLYLFTGQEAKKEEMIRATVHASLDVYMKGLKTIENEGIVFDMSD